MPFPDAASRRAFLTCALSRPEMDHHLSPEDLEEVVKRTAGGSGRIWIWI